MSSRQRLAFLLALLAFGQAAQGDPPAGGVGEPAHTDRFGDPLPDGALVRLGTVRLRHGNVVQAVAVSPDGKTLASTSRGNELVFWEAATGREVRRITNPAARDVEVLVFSPDSKTLASGSDHISLWEADTGRELLHLKDGEYENYKALAFSPDGRTLASGSAGHHLGQEHLESHVCLWDSATGQMQRRLPGLADMIEGVAFSPSGTTIASASRDKTIRLWDRATGKELRVLGDEQEPKTRVAFAPDGKLLAYGDWKGNVVVWDLLRDAEARRIPAHRQPIESLEFAPDGKSLLSGVDSDGAVRLWDPTTGDELAGPTDLDLKACFGAFGLDGKSLVGWGCDNLIHVWDLAERREKLPAEGHPYRMCCVSVSRDGRQIATGGDDGLRVWDRATGKEVWRHETKRKDWVWGAWITPFGEESGWCVAFAPDGKSLASGTGDGDVRLWDAATGQELRRIRTGEGAVFGVAFSPDGRTLYSGGYDLVETWDAATGRLIRQKGKKPPPDERPDGRRSHVTSLCVSADGRLVAADIRGRLRLWRADSGEDVLGLPGVSRARPLRKRRGHEQWAALSPDGSSLIATGAEVAVKDEVHRWDVGAEGRAGWRAPAPFGCATMSFGADSRTVASTCTDGKLVLWDADTGKSRCTFRGHQGEVAGAVFSPDGRLVVSFGDDGTAVVWDAAGRAPPLPSGLGRGEEWRTFWTEASLTARDSENPDDTSVWDVLGFLGRASTFWWVAGVAVSVLLATLCIRWLRGRRKA